MPSNRNMPYVRLYDDPAGTAGGTRLPYSKPQVGAIDLQNHETLGIGCKTGTSGTASSLCNTCSNLGS